MVDAKMTVFDQDLLKSYHCIIYGNKVLYIDFVTKKNVQDFDMKMTMFALKQSNHQVNVLNITLPGCKTLSQTQRANLLKIVAREVFRVANVPKKCPLLKDTLYSINNYTIRDDDFPVFTPTITWQLHFDILIANQTVAKVTINGRVRKLL
ncbi:uncharacterized protein LOC131806807 [Musca domestica]|uniref:Uncharacterized protein LOC131806807 n=1 Tax=Musca domestica TaxID=7370 RepID=A0ABM3VNW2_MUSDO|nr:uncharacterized protein LOC131806807 [Musca domestica]